MTNITIHKAFLKTATLSLLTLMAACAYAQTEKAHPLFMHVDSNVVWQAPPDFRALLDKNCDSLEGRAFQRCFLDLMRENGATQEAIHFTMLTDTTGYVRHFVNSGAVDIAYVFYPFRANENFGITLVNGTPATIDVDDLRFLDLTELKKDSTYLSIVDSFPDAAVWPGDRYHFSEPRYESLPGGGQRFIVRYLLKNACHACRNVGIVDFSFDFDSSGTFEGTRLLHVLPITH